MSWAFLTLVLDVPLIRNTLCQIHPRQISDLRSPLKYLSSERFPRYTTSLVIL